MYHRASTVYSVAPSRRDNSAVGSIITVAGAHFSNSKESICIFGKVKSGRTLYVSSSIIRCLVPNLNTGTVLVSVSNNGVDRGFGSAKFVTSSFSITSVFPHVGLASSSHSIVLTFTPPLIAKSIECMYFGHASTRGSSVKPQEVRCPVPSTMRPGRAYLSLVLDGAQSANTIDSD